MSAPSGTYDFAPSVGECVLNALSRIRIRGPMVKAEHLFTVQMEANLMQQQWNNMGCNLWTQDNDPIVITASLAKQPTMCPASPSWSPM